MLISFKVNAIAIKAIAIGSIADQIVWSQQKRGYTLIFMILCDSPDSAQDSARGSVQDSW